MSPPGAASHPMLLSVATPSRDNMPCTTTKGLLNEPGQNNCFLNSAVQVLWHLDIFRRSFRDLMGHACMADSCIFCALKELFSQLQFSNESALPPDALRKALAESFSDQQRFQLGFMDDAAECFENILLRIHMHIAHEESQDMCNAGHCIPHQKFAMTLVEQTVCGSCGATSEPLSYTQMVHYVSTSTLVYQVRQGGARASPYNHTTFGQLLRKAGNMGDVRMCPSHCGAVIQISRTLMNWPEIVSIGLVWNSERPSLEHIMEVFSTIGTSMLLGDVFTSVTDKKWTENCTHNLVGVVTYYGKHYSTFFFHTKLRVWIYFDDATVRQVGPHWEQVVEKCRKGRYQPLLLLYATPDGTPVNTDNAPKQVTQICPQKNTPKKSTAAQNFLRRSVTPSPEKPNIGNTRRAITPSPECSVNQKPPLPKPFNEYQNLSVIQNNLHASTDAPDGYVGRKEPYVKKLDMDAINKPSINIHRTLSNGSSSGIEGMSDHNFPRRRDSGNWSGDRNSASSASSTTMDNPYLYLIGKVPPGNVPESPTLVKSDSSSAGSAIYDAGYDSYSLSSNDSSTMTTLQHMMKIGHLAKIPEDYSNLPNQATQSCDTLCDEADKLLVKSRQLEDEHDLVLALALCNAAATKARAAMNAPYNNPQTLTLARMKHNTCIMRARSLHRRMTQTASSKDSAPPEIRHTREGSSGSGKHSRQNSRDKGQHSRQNSKELLTNIPPPEKVVSKNIEIYATLPKRKDSMKNRIDNINFEEPVDYVSSEKQPLKEGRGFFSRSKQKDNTKREKRSRSEDRSKRVVEFTLTPEIIEIKPKPKEDKNEKQEKDGKSKKQHKIRRKLLMGGLIKRKNRSMPDLTDANPEMAAPIPQPQLSSVDDSKVGLKGSLDNTQPSMSGYLSKGHLEFNANNTNPNLKKSKLMRKSFYASAGKILSVPKVPPPPPLRTTSQLSTSKPQLNGDEIKDCRSEYQNLYELSNNIKCNTSIIEMLKFEQMQNRSLNESNSSTNSLNTSTGSYNNQPITLITTADVHRESIGSIEHLNTSSVDEVDCLPRRANMQTLELPPYPSPAGSTVHSRQASEEFPPPPPPLDLSALDEHLPQCSAPQISCNSLLGQLQNKREQIFAFESAQHLLESNNITSSGDTWLRELQAKQAALKVKRINSFNKKDEGVDVVNTQKVIPNDTGLKAASVKDLTSKFESRKPEILSDSFSVAAPILSEDRNMSRVQNNMPKKPDIETIAPEQIAEEIREVERINATLQETLNYNKQNAIEERRKNKLGKKKSVSFCDQVILVATAEDQEDDSYIPNPILERVLRSAINKPENNEADAKTSDEVTKHPQEVEELHINLNQSSSMDEQKTSSDNLFDITMRNTMENSRIMNPNLITRIANLESPKSVVPQQSTYSSVAFAQNKNLQSSTLSPPTSNNTLPSQPLYSVNPHSQSPSNVPQQNQLHGFLHNDGYIGQENNANAMPYNHHPQHLSSSIQQPIYQQQPIYSANSQQQYQQYSGINISQQGYGYANPPQQVHVQQQNQQYYQPTQNAHYGGHYQQKQNYYAPISSYPQNQHLPNSAPQSMYSSPPQTAVYSAQPNYQKSYGMDGQLRQPQNTLQPNYVGQTAKPNYHYPPQPLKGHNQLSRTSGLYQSVPFSSKQNPHSVYQRMPSSEYNINQNTVYQRIPSKPHVPESEQQKLYDVYQRVPSPHGERDGYQQIPPNLKKCVSFETSTHNAERSDPSLPKAVVTPILVNNANNSIPDKTKCNLCRKKIVASSNLYCADCEYYMSRFKPKT